MSPILLTASQAANRTRFTCSLLFLIVCYFATALLILPKHGHAEEWLFEPSLDLKESHSNNVWLAPTGNEKSDWVTQIDPGASLTKKGAYLKVNANYQMQNLFYSENSKIHKRYHLLNADTNIKLVENFLFIDGKAAITQQNISALGPLAVDNTNISSNRTNVENYSIAPYMHHNFHDFVSTELRHTQNGVKTNTTGLANLSSHSDLFNLESGTSFKTLGWGLNYNKSQTTYNDIIQTAGNTGSKNYAGNLRYHVTPRFSLKLTAGYEKFDYLATGQAPRGSNQTVGFSWSPSERTTIDASAGHRFFGKTYMFNASHSNRRSVWNMGYNEDITTTQSQFLVPSTIDTASFLNKLWASSIPDDTTRQQAVNAFIHDMGLPNSLANPVNFLSNRVFLQKSLQASVATTGTKNTIMLSLYGLSRKAQTSATMDSAILGASNLSSYDNTKQIGGTALWNWQISTRTNVNFSADASKIVSIYHLKSLKIGILRQLQPKINGSVDYRRTQQHSDQTGSGYQENTFAASLSMKF